MIKKFTLLNNDFKIFDKHLDKKFETLMKDHLNITDEEKEQIVRESIFEYFEPYKMCEHINYALRHSGKYHRYEVNRKHKPESIVRIQYKESSFSTSRFNAGEIFYKFDSNNMDKIENINMDEFKQKFYEWAKPWFISRTNNIMKQIIFQWCLLLNEEKNANVIEYDGLIHGDYDDLVKTYNHLLSL